MDAAVREVPAEVAERWTSRVCLRDGAELCIRPLRADDREREIAFMNGLSERTRYFRLMTPLKFLSTHLIDQLMDVDYHSRVALVATVERNGAEEFVGIVRYGETTERGVGELGITVADAWQRRGIARLLLGQLLDYARWRGFERIIGVVLPENHQMLALARSLGFRARYDSADHLIHITHDLHEAQEALLLTPAKPRADCGEPLAGS